MMQRLIVTTLLTILVAPAQSQDGRDDTAPKTIQEKTQDMMKLEGYFNLYWDADAEKLWLEVDKWDTEFLLHQSTPANTPAGDRGALGRSRVVKFAREAKKIFMIQPNYSYRALSEDALERRSVDEAYYPAILHGFRVGAETNGNVLIDITKLIFTGDALRSAIYWPHTKAFPNNVEIEATITTNASNTGGAARGRGRGRGRGNASTPQTIRKHVSLVKLPDDKYVPRLSDPRSAVGSRSFMDYATPISSSIHTSYINRHRLVKKDPTAAQSEPIEPIIYYIDPGAPEPVRSALVEGGRWWNDAFNAIGFKNAFDVRVLPADADPMDLRYNMVLWTHRPSRGWSSGHQVTDPRTGEIIAGRVYLGSQRVRQDFLIGTGLLAAHTTTTPEYATIREMALARLRQLSAHEIGHTLGFSHNFAASTMGRTSVMDYPHPTIKANADGTLDFSDTYGIGIGAWDKVTVAYAYSHFPPGTDERASLNQIMDDAHARGLFYNQQVGAGSSSPLTHQWDNGANALVEFENVLMVRKIGLANMSEQNIAEGQPMETLEQVLVPVYLYHRYQTEAVSKSLGGIDYRFALRGDGQKVAEPVPADAQREALSALLRTLQPEFLEVPRHIRDLIPPRHGRRGEVFPRHTRPGFDPLAAAETGAALTLSLILNPNRAARLVQQHAENQASPSFSEVLDQLINRTWQRARTSNRYLAEVGRAIDDITLNQLMGLAANTGATTQVRALASLKIAELKIWLEQATATDDAQSAHYYFGAEQIRMFQMDSSKFVLTPIPDVPAGAPIGMGEALLPGMDCGWIDLNGR